MSDEALQNALRRKARLEKELKDINEFIRLYRQFGTEPEQMLSVSSEDSGGTPSEGLKHIFAATRANPPRKVLEPLIQDLIMARYKPMTRGELVNALASYGVNIRAADPRKAMGTMMWRMRDKFVNIEGQGYWLRDQPLASVGYKP